MEGVVFEPTGDRFTFAEVELQIALKKGDRLSVIAPAGESEVAMIDYVSTRIDADMILSGITIEPETLQFVGQAKEVLEAVMEPEHAAGDLVWSRRDCKR